MARYDWLAIDVGTSHTVAVLGAADGRTRQLLFDGTPLLPSAVYAVPDGTLVVGTEAVHLARQDPARFEPNPKRRVDEGSVLLGDREVPVVDLIGAVLRQVAAEAIRVAGGGTAPPSVLTHPVDWGPVRREVLLAAARQAGLEVLRVLPEPVAAASFYTGVLGRDVAVRQALAVVDFGGGTFDVAVLRRTAEGFTVAGAGGADDLGGLDLDAAVIAHLRAGPGLDERAWARLDQPTTLADRRDRAALWADARTAKEILSRRTQASVQLPGAVAPTHLTRAEFEQLAAPAIDRAVQLTARVLADAGVAAPAGSGPHPQLVGLFLVGGSSRIPLLGQRLHRALGFPPTVLEQPETAVAEGALRHVGTVAPHVVAALDRMAAPPPSASGSAGGVAGVAGAAPERYSGDDADPGAGAGAGRRLGLNRRVPRSWRRPLVAGTALGVVGVLAAGLVIWTSYRDGAPGPRTSPTATATSAASAPRFRLRTPVDTATDPELRSFLQVWREYAFSVGCRLATEPEYRPDGRVHNTLALTPIPPTEVVHCASGDFEAIFARYEGSGAERVEAAYAGAPGIEPVEDERLPADAPPLYLLPQWTDTQHALMWREAHVIGWLITSRGETNLVQTWLAQYRPN